ncbi:hypothetical protein B4143_0063 [Bacillus subtilis]|nr:hypothetical protein B4143_0063 [Bacillus subtilis]
MKERALRKRLFSLSPSFFLSLNERSFSSLCSGSPCGAQNKKPF